MTKGVEQKVFFQQSCVTLRGEGEDEVKSRRHVTHSFFIRSHSCWVRLRIDVQRHRWAVIAI
ncbi:hypothetical protein QJS04_geneDACA006985 [Acorus gramineus]|uniref:Uncharacterized protein n=1 Tax=Acorus gramineus TaxID=55184 RepID=A0AAV9A2I1_ACOGR|nr:hypothetical protein QJS04_geneDACA006985 [Acorus gramineus]